MAVDGRKKRRCPGKDEYPVFSAFSCPRRLQILKYVAKKRRSVGEIAKFAEIDISVASRHLKMLRTAGVVVQEREGNSIFYSEKDPKILDVLKELIRLSRLKPKKIKGK